MIRISNAFLTAQFHAKGAELCSLQNATGEELIWDGNPSVWGRHAPVLFPIVGKLNANQFVHKGKTYSLPQHGFARDQMFEVLEQSADAVRFLLKHSENSLKIYPFLFALEIAYTLERNMLHIDYVVRNLGDEEMFFSIGAHPAFVLEGERKQYSLLFSEQETASKYLLQEGVFNGDTKPVLHNSAALPITNELFDEDALVFKNLVSKTISIAKQGKPFIAVHFEGFPYMGIWSKNRNAPFVCIEPWFGLADNILHNGDISTKEGIQRLLPAASFLCRHSFEVLLGA